MEYSGDETADEESNRRRYIVTTTKKLFSNDIIKFIHNNSYIINELLNSKESQEIDRFWIKLQKG